MTRTEASGLLIDVHSHWYPRTYIEMLRARKEPPQIVERDGPKFVIFPGESGRPMDEQYWSLEAKLSFMSRHEIDQTVLSLGNPWLDPFDGPEAPELAKKINAEFAKLESRTAGRILGLGVLPHNSVSSAVAGLETIAHSGALYGVVSGYRICGFSLDAPELDSFWAQLEQLGLPIMFHPHYSAAADALEGFGHALPVAVGFTFETTIALSRLLFAGVLHRYPDLKIVMSHGGGALPFLAGRLDAGWKSDPSTHERLQAPPSKDMPKLYSDAMVYHERSMGALTDLLGAGHLSFGTDHPFSVADPKANLDAIVQAFGSVDRSRVRSSSAQELFGLPRPQGV